MGPDHHSAASRLGRFALIALAGAFLLLFLVVPLATVFSEALAEGMESYLAALAAPDALAAIRLTLLVAAISVPLNTVFRLLAACCTATFAIPGKSLLITLIDLPFSA